MLPLQESTVRRAAASRTTEANAICVTPCNSSVIGDEETPRYITLQSSCSRPFLSLFRVWLELHGLLASKEIFI